MTTPAARPSQVTAPEAAPLSLERGNGWRRVAILFVFFVPYQTLVQTVITDDAVRKGIEADGYDMTWVAVAYGVGVIYGVFGGLSLSFLIGKRYTVAVAMLVFCAGNILCGSRHRPFQPGARPVRRGVWKMTAMAVCRAMLYKQFDRAPWWPSAFMASSPIRHGILRHS